MLVVGRMIHGTLSFFKMANAPARESLPRKDVSPSASSAASPLSGQDLGTLLLANLEAFTAFARNRLGEAELARDAVQESLIKAVTAERQPAAEPEVVRWFYRILRRTIIDLHRRREARARAYDGYAANLEAEPESAEKALLCACFQRLLPELSPAERRLIEQVDLEDGSPARLAEEQGISANALGVRLHRARQHLRALLEDTCRVCAEHGCLDCHCAPASPAAGGVQD